MSKLILLLVLGGFVTYGVISLTQNRLITEATDTSTDVFIETKLRSIATSSMEMLMSKVADDTTFRVKSPQAIALFDGSAAYTVTDVNFDGEDLIKFSVTASLHGATKTITAYAEKSTFPSSLSGAVTANNHIKTEGNLTIDGRNHDLSGNLISNSGSYAVWTTAQCSQGGSSDLGGTYQNSDYAPSRPGDPRIIKEYQTFPGGFPNTPDKVLGGASNGFPEGTLKALAKSGVNGSQYVTDPKNLNKKPFSGVTYVELSKNDVWNSMDVSGSGILVVHNSSNNAIMKNLNKGTFSGIIIVDDLIHVHSDIIGSIVVLSDKPSNGNCVGNGKGKILYSSEAIKGALKSANFKSSDLNYGFGNNRLHVKHWLE
jgi:hypothetical protein